MAHYCFECGAQVVEKFIDGRLREICPSCGWVHYEHRKVSAAVRIVKDNKLLLVQRAIEPWKSAWHMPAGYLEVDETPQECAAREAREETGYEVMIGELAGIYTYEDDPRGNGIVLLYSGEISGGAVRKNHEMLNVGFFSPEEASKLKKAGSGGTRQIQDWIRQVKESSK